MNVTENGQKPNLIEVEAEEPADLQTFYGIVATCYRESGPELSFYVLVNLTPTNSGLEQTRSKFRAGRVISRRVSSPTIWKIHGGPGPSHKRKLGKWLWIDTK